MWFFAGMLFYELRMDALSQMVASTLHVHHVLSAIFSFSLLPTTSTISVCFLHRSSPTASSAQKLGSHAGQAPLRSRLALKIHLHGRLNRMLHHVLLTSTPLNLALRGLVVKQLGTENLTSATECTTSTIESIAGSDLLRDGG